MKVKEKLMSLKNGEKYIIPESDYGKAEIWYIHDCYFIFTIPMYGGKPAFETVVQGYENKEQQMKKVLDIINNWT